jgi:hypothetical protein
LRTTLTYALHPRFKLGIEYNPLADSASPLANWLAVSETEHRPAVMFGTSSDRIGTPRGEAFYGTLSKSLEPHLGLPVAPYVGVSYGTYEDRFRPIAGANIQWSPRFSSLIIFDGVQVHPTLDFAPGRHVISVLLVRGRDPGVSYSISF